MYVTSLRRTLSFTLALTTIAACGWRTAPALATPTAGASLSFQPMLGLPASAVSLIGASPGETAGETWAQGYLGGVPTSTNPGANGQVLLRYSSAAQSWQDVPVADAHGSSIEFQWWGSEVTSQGGVVLAGSGAAHPNEAQSVVTRDPGGAFALAPAPTIENAGTTTADAVLEHGEQLYSTSPSAGGPLIAAIAESSGHTGVLIAPVRAGSGSEGAGSGSEHEGAGEGTAPGGEHEAEHSGPAILHYDGASWSREPICASVQANTCQAPTAPLTELAVSASSAQNAWLLASTATQPAILFQREAEASGQNMWVLRHPSGWLLGSGSPPLSEEKVAPVSEGPRLTASGQGTWVDLQLNAPTAAGNATAFVSGGESSQIAGTWCYPLALCPAGTSSLGAALPADYGSFAWPGASAGDPGARIITGLSDGALLRLQDSSSEGSASQPFSLTMGGGGGGASAIGPGGVTLGEIPGTRRLPVGGAAFATPEEGWLGNPGAPQALHVTAHPAADALQSWPVPFRRPLLAIAGEPGFSAGDASAQTLAVGSEGEVARYIPGQGWEGEYLYNSSGERQTPNLRAVAWPEAGRAFAVGDNGAMWVWQSATGLWEPDPAAPPGFRGQLTAIAFSPSNPDLGYAVGKQGVLLSYGKSWSQEPLPPGLAQANFTSVAFAGGEAIATYRTLNPANAVQETGGVIVNAGQGWQLDPSAQELLGRLPPQETVLSRVAGLPDGGAVAAGPGIVIERDSATSAWRLSDQPLPEASNVSALGAFREGTSVRALISIDTTGEDNPNGGLIYQSIDNPPGPALEQYGLLRGADPLPGSGYLLRETSGGWQDEESDDYVYPSGDDLPGWPDAVLALSVDPTGQQGWAVGGQTGSELTLYGSTEAQAAVQTAGVMRYGPGPSPPQSSTAPISIPANQATFAVGGNARCASACADLTAEQLGPDTWLTGALARANQIAGLRAFLYTGAHIADAGAGDEFERELSEYASLLHSGGSLPVYAAISPSDLEAGSTAGFSAALGASAPAGSVPTGTPAPPAGYAAYASDSTGNGGTVRLIVLDDSQEQLSPSDTTEPSCPADWGAPANQLQWLCAQLHYAAQSAVPAIVLGNQAPASGPDAAELQQVLLTQGASAYLFDSPGKNISTKIGSVTSSIPALGSGTLGYVLPQRSASLEFFGASGFLLVSVNAAQRNPTTNRAPVSANLIPNAGQLGLEAADGTLLRRSQVALFEGLARRPLGGVEKITTSGSLVREAPDPYTNIPEQCLGTGCAAFLPPAYSFTSSNPDIGDFVEPDPNSTNPRTVFRGAGGKPVHDSNSGLFCAYNAGTTTVTVSAGGLTYSEQVTVQGGSVEQPCGTVPLSNPPAAQTQSVAVTPAPLPLSPAPAPTPALALTPPAPSPVLTPRVRVPHALATPFVIPLLTQAPAPLPVRAAVPPPVPQTARPSPPSGTSEVTQPVGAAEREHESEQATDVVHNMAAYPPDRNVIPPWSPLAVVLILAAAGGTLRRAGRGREPLPAWASIGERTYSDAHQGLIQRNSTVKK